MNYTIQRLLKFIIATNAIICSSNHDLRKTPHVCRRRRQFWLAAQRSCLLRNTHHKLSKAKAFCLHSPGAAFLLREIKPKRSAGPSRNFLNGFQGLFKTSFTLNQSQTGKASDPPQRYTSMLIGRRTRPGNTATTRLVFLILAETIRGLCAREKTSIRHLFLCDGEPR